MLNRLLIIDITNKAIWYVEMEIRLPIKRINLTMNVLLKEQESYDILSRKISEINEPFTMREVEGSTFGEPSIPQRKLENLIHECKNEFAVLDRFKPIYESTERGKHFACELFFEDPSGWGSRWAPFIWAYCARHFSNDILPMDNNFLIEKYYKFFLELGIPIDGEDSAFVEQFAWSGMSSGVVNGFFAKESLKSLILRNIQMSKYSC